jgi:hypothetical protein
MTTKGSLWGDVTVLRSSENLAELFPGTVDALGMDFIPASFAPVQEVDFCELSVALEELKRFFQIAMILQATSKMTGMPSCYLDTLWHQLLENPAEYETFCLDAVGVHLDHLPYNGEGILDWVPLYHSMFGIMPPIWFTDLEGNFSATAYDEYVETGVVKASWDCGPARL